MGILAFPPGPQIVQAAGTNTSRITRKYPRTKVASLASLTEGQPVDFAYPLEEHDSFLVKVGKPAQGGVGPEGDVVAFSYLCSHMGCPLDGKYRPEATMMGPCPCHFSTFDLSKSGTLVLGQATQSLPQIVLEVSDGDIFASGVTGLVYGYRDNLDGTPATER